VRKAAQEFQKALRENPKDPLTNLYLAGIAVRQQRFNEALGFLVIPQAALPTNPLVHHLLGRCYLELKDLGKAKSELLATVDANPEDSGAHYLLARVYRELGDTQNNAREIELFQKLTRTEKEKKLMNAEKGKLAGDLQ